MTKERKIPTVAKPIIDDEAVLRFVEGKSVGRSDDGTRRKQGDTIRLTVQVQRDLYAALEREAARKKRTVEEYVHRLLTKHCG